MADHTQLTLLLLLGKNIFLPVVLGFVLAIFPWGSEEHFNWFLKKIVINIFIPLLILEKITCHLNKADLTLSWGAMAGALCMVGINIFLAHLWAQSKAYQDLPPSQVRLSLGLHNFGFVAYPLVEQTLGPRGLALCFMYTVAADALTWSVGPLLLPGANSGPKFSWQKILTPPLLAALGGFFFVFQPFVSLNFEVFFTPVKPLLPYFLPLALVCVGGLLRHNVKQQKFSPTLIKPLIYGLIFRHSIIPLLWIFLLWKLYDLGILRDIFLIQGIMPASSLAPALIGLYIKDNRFAVFFSLLSLLFSLFTLPFYLGFITHFLF